MELDCYCSKISLKRKLKIVVYSVFHFSNKRFDWGSTLKKTAHCEIKFLHIYKGMDVFLKNM